MAGNRRRLSRPNNRIGRPMPYRAPRRPPSSDRTSRPLLSFGLVVVRIIDLTLAIILTRKIGVTCYGRTLILAFKQK